MSRFAGLGRRATGVVALVPVLFALAGCGREPATGPAWDFARVGADGAVLAASAQGSHDCVLDRRTGLLWEAKRGEPGLRYGDDTYSWHSEDPAEHNSEPGLPDGGECGVGRCDTAAFVAAVNGAGLCGRADWRLPSRDEALTLFDVTRIGQGPVLDPEFFPHAAAGEYWTVTTFRMYPRGAWAVDTVYAQDRVDWKTEAKRVRLVSGPKDAVKPKRRGK
jgi:hypothetical protein